MNCKVIEKYPLPKLPPNKILQMDLSLEESAALYLVLFAFLALKDPETSLYITVENLKNHSVFKKTIIDIFGPATTVQNIKRYFEDLR